MSESLKLAEEDIGYQYGMELDNTRTLHCSLDISAQEKGLTAQFWPDDVLLLLLLLLLLLWPQTSKNGSFGASGMPTAAEAAGVHV